MKDTTAPRNRGRGTQPPRVSTEIPVGPPGATPLPPASPTEPPLSWLQAEPEESPREPVRKKASASQRAASTSAQDAASLAIVAALQRDLPLMAALWPDVRPAELLRSPPPIEAFQARCDFARRAIDAVGRRDADARAQAELAQRRLSDQLTRLGRDGAAARTQFSMRTALEWDITAKLPPALVPPSPPPPPQPPPPPPPP